MIEIGAQMITRPSADRRRAEHGAAGVRPVPARYAVNQTNPHLHNVPLQIAAERGVPALTVWLGFIAVVARALFRLFRRWSPALATDARQSSYRQAGPPAPNGCSPRQHWRRLRQCWPRDCLNTTSATPSS